MKKLFFCITLICLIDSYARSSTPFSGSVLWSDSITNSVLVTVDIVVEEIDTSEGTWFVDENATFLGGDLNSFSDWLGQQIEYPEEAANERIQGKVFAQFAVNRFGRVTDVKVIKSVHPYLDNEVIRAIKLSPEWKPAGAKGEPVKQIFVIPVNFDQKYYIPRRKSSPL